MPGDSDGPSPFECSRVRGVEKTIGTLTHEYHILCLFGVLYLLLQVHYMKGLEYSLPLIVMST